MFFIATKRYNFFNFTSFQSICQVFENACKQRAAKVMRCKIELETVKCYLINILF